MKITMVGISHKTAAVEVREKAVFPESEITGTLQTLIHKTGIEGAAIVSTCNRTEIYVSGTSVEKAGTVIVELLSKTTGLDPLTLKPHLYTKSEDAAALHLFTVVSSLDSLVVGETQILGQIRQAYKLAEQAHTTSELINLLFRQALSVGKRIRNETQIGAQSVSISTAAVTLASRIFDSLVGRTVLLVGAGKMAELCARYLKESGAQSILVANRTLQRAQELAQHFNGTAVAFDALPAGLEKADIVISSTAAPDYIIGPDLVRSARKHRKGHSLLLIDIALPRDIDPSCNEIRDVFVFDLDDLAGVTDNNKELRLAETQKVQKIIDSELRGFKSYCQSLSVQPTIKELRLKANQIAEDEVRRALKKLSSNSPTDQETLEHMAQAIVKKVLHGPTARLQLQAVNPDAHPITESVRYLFGLDSNPDNRCNRECQECAYYAAILQIQQGEVATTNDIAPRFCSYAELIRKSRTDHHRA